MTQIDYTRAAKYFLLQDFWVGMKLGLKYFFAPKATVNYPHEKSAASPASCAKRSARRRPSPLTRNPARTARAVPRAMTSI